MYRYPWLASFQAVRLRGVTTEGVENQVDKKRAGHRQLRTRKKIKRDICGTATPEKTNARILEIKPGQVPL